jgi:hypothetical protein
MGKRIISKKTKNQNKLSVKKTKFNVAQITKKNPFIVQAVNVE